MHEGLLGQRGLIERDVELREVERALLAAAAGTGRLVLVRGPAGIGKTALLEEARRQARQTRVRAITCRGNELEGEFPYGVVRQMLEPVIRGASQQERERLLSGAAALGAPAVLGAGGRPAAGEAAFAVLHGLYWLVANLSAEMPLALLVDDVHWADAASLRFLTYLGRRLDGLATTVIASVRTADITADAQLLSELEQFPHTTVASPAALSEAGVLSVLRLEFGEEPDPEFARACQKVTGGNPFLLRELTAALIAEGAQPTSDATRYVVATAPPSIVRNAVARLQRLPGDAIELARAIAVLGGDATLPRAAVITELDESRALAALDVLIDADLVIAAPRIEFRHPILRTAIYDDLAVGARSTAHKRVARLLQDEGEEIDAVAGHLLLSEPIGEPETIDTLRAAAANAVALGVPEAAARYLARALAEGPTRQLRITTLMELALAEKLARLPQAADRFSELRRLAEDSITRARATLELADLRWYAGAWEQGKTLLDDALAELAGSDDPLVIKAETTRAAFSAFTPRLVGGFIASRPGLDDRVASRAAGTRPLALLLAANRAYRDEPSAEVLALVKQGWENGQYLNEGDSIELLPQGISAALLIEELGLADEIVHATRVAAQTSGSVMQYLVAGAHHAWVLARRGDLTAAAGEMRASIERAVELQQLFPVIVTMGYCADVMLERPDLDDLAAMVETIELRELGESLAGAMLIGTRGRLRFAAGQRLTAIADLRHAIEIAAALQLRNLADPSWRSGLAMMLGRSETDEALELVRAELADAQARGLARRMGIALRTLGVLEPDRTAGRTHLQAAASLLAGSPAPLEYARALVDLGADTRRRGERAAARDPLRRGLDLAVRCGASRLAQRARTELAATGARPRRQRTTGRAALTPSELRVALMAAEGQTSQQIAQALFVTTKTVDTHLNHTYAKLKINSRKQLSAALGETSVAVSDANDGSSRYG